jgi:hypothetical protein
VPTHLVNQTPWDDERPNDRNAMGGFEIGPTKLPYVSLTQLDHGLYQFILNIVSSLITLESLAGNGVSGLSVFARLDISVYRRTESGEICFMINGATKHLCSNLGLTLLRD